MYTTDFLTGIADTTAVAEIKTIEHFTHALTETESGRIAPDGSTVLKVYYTRNEYIVIFDGNGGTLQSGGVTQIVKYGSSVIAPTYIRTGYTFDSFDKSLTDIAENQTISAQWIINQYTITLVYGNGQDNRVITQDYATDIEIENPTRAGYAFNGWDNMIPTQMPAENITVTANWEAIFKLDGGAIKGLTEYGKTISELIIPSEIDGVAITSIGRIGYIIEVNNTLTSVIIEKGITSIADETFYNCRKLTKVTIPDSITSIGEDVFLECRSFEDIYITDISAWCGISCAYWGSKPGSYNLYLNNELVTELIIPDGVTSIGNRAFSGCKSLTKITIPDSVTSIGSYAFDGCSNLTEVYITDKAAWDSISFDNESANPLNNGAKLYLNNKLVTEFIVLDGVASIGSYAFNGCSSLIEIIIPDSVTSIGDHAFLSCSRLIKLTIGNGLTSIGFDVFSFCSGLTEVTISDSVTSIGSYAFAYCTSLTEITIPNSVISIASEAFYGCSNLTEITIPDSVTSIGAFAFSNCTNLTKVTIGKGVTSIGYYAFSGCGKLTEITIPDSVTSICLSAFANCKSLREVTIGNSVTSINYDAFYECRNLTKINYDGTLSQWNAILKYNGWDNYTGDYTVYCTDGTIQK